MSHVREIESSTCLMSAPSVSVGSRVLVTGVSGYIAAHIADQLIKAGYFVKGTVRDLSKINQLKERLGDHFEAVEADIREEGVFDDLVKDVDAIIHTASPVTYDIKDPFKESIDPAVQGSLNVLKSAHSYGKKVKHVIVTSSIASLLHPAPPGYVYTEDDWNDDAIKKFSTWKPGDSVDGVMAYIAGKNEAERAIWKFREENNPSFRLTAILPASVFGPFITEISSSKLTSPSLIFPYFAGKKKEVEPVGAFQSWVDVRDVALMHLRALEKGDVADGQRFIAATGTYTNQKVVDILRKHFPERKDTIPLGTPSQNYSTITSVSGKKATEVLGVSYEVGFEQCLVDMCNDFNHLL